MNNVDVGKLETVQKEENDWLMVNETFTFISRTRALLKTLYNAPSIYIDPIMG